jgi:hypothetical protein
VRSDTSHSLNFCEHLEVFARWERRDNSRRIEMRTFSLLIVVGIAASACFASSADSARGLSLASPQAREEAANLRCAKRIALVNETVCLMQRRNRA